MACSNRCLCCNCSGDGERNCCVRWNRPTEGLRYRIPVAGIDLCRNGHCFWSQRDGSVRWASTDDNRTSLRPSSFGHSNLDRLHNGPGRSGLRSGESHTTRKWRWRFRRGIDDAPRNPGSPHVYVNRPRATRDHVGMGWRKICDIRVPNPETASNTQRTKW